MHFLVKRKNSREQQQHKTSGMFDLVFVELMHQSDSVAVAAMWMPSEEEENSQLIRFVCFGLELFIAEMYPVWFFVCLFVCFPHHLQGLTPSQQIQTSFH